MQKLTNFIDGTPVPPLSGSYFDNLNPATGEILSRVPDSGPEDIDHAVAAARAAVGPWSDMPVSERSRILSRLADLIERETETLAHLESTDNGKPVHLARQVDIPRASANLRFFAAAIQGFASESHPMGRGGFNYTLRSPLGIVGAISPWNLPLYLFTWKIAPALATGNCVVAKPSELTPMTAYKLGFLAAEAGLPPGVLNIVQGYGSKTGKAIAAHPEIPAVTFTGGTQTGRAIAETAAPLFKKLSLEMGGKNPVLIFADSSPSLYEEMLETTIRSSFSNQGEICLCGSRIYIEEPLYGRFRDDFVRRTRELIVGDPQDAETDLGAVNSEAHLHKILSYVELAVKEGGTIRCGGKQVSLPGRCSGGWFVEPTVIEGLPDNCRTNQEEIFGPVVTIAPFRNEEGAVRSANSTQYGLASVVWTSDLRRAHRVADSVQTGIVWVNCWMVRDLRTPFGGAKYSGLGREGGIEALRFFTEPKNICVQL